MELSTMVGEVILMGFRVLHIFFKKVPLGATKVLSYQSCFDYMKCLAINLVLRLSLSQGSWRIRFAFKHYLQIEIFCVHMSLVPKCYFPNILEHIGP